MTKMPMDQNFYQLLDISSSASSDEIHNAYRKQSKIYHPDTTTLPQNVAIQKFQQLNDAYGTLSNPDLRRAYDYRLSISSVKDIPLPKIRTSDVPFPSSQVQIQERPLSSGELFALLILGLTFLGCLILAIVVAFTRGEMMFEEATIFIQMSSKFFSGFYKPT